MTTTLALAGKGGVGKTTIAALLIHALMERHAGSILAIDADPSTNLNVALGMSLEGTVGDIREGMLAQVKESLLAGGAAMCGLPGGVSKRDFLEYQVQASLSEGDQCDLIAMGRPEGVGCYCAVNHNLRQVIDSLSRNYRYIVIDNEAGMEHLSRRTTRDVNHLLIVTEASHRSLIAAERIASFRHELDINIQNTALILNRFSGEIPDSLRGRLDEMGIPLLGTVPQDPELAGLEMNGRPVTDLHENSPVYRAVLSILQNLI